MGDNAKIPNIFHNNLKAGIKRICGDLENRFAPTNSNN